MERISIADIESKKTFYIFKNQVFGEVISKDGIDHWHLSTGTRTLRDISLVILRHFFISRSKYSLPRYATFLGSFHF